MPGLFTSIVIICLLFIGCANTSQMSGQNQSILPNSYSDSGNRIKAAEELLNVMDMRNTLQQTMEQMIEVQIQQNPAIKPYRHVMLEFINKYMSYDSLKEDLIALYADAFNQNEIHEIIEFYRTPTGQKTIQKLPGLAKKGSQLGLARMESNKDVLKEMIEKESARLKQFKIQ
jgi:hypothetical protein